MPHHPCGAKRIPHDYIRPMLNSFVGQSAQLDQCLVIRGDEDMILRRIIPELVLDVGFPK